MTRTETPGEEKCWPPDPSRQKPVAAAPGGQGTSTFLFRCGETAAEMPAASRAASSRPQPHSEPCTAFCELCSEQTQDPFQQGPGPARVPQDLVLAGEHGPCQSALPGLTEGWRRDPLSEDCQTSQLLSCFLGDQQRPGDEDGANGEHAGSRSPLQGWRESKWCGHCTSGQALRPEPHYGGTGSFLWPRPGPCSLH